MNKKVCFLSNASTLGVQAQESPDLFMGVEQNVNLCGNVTTSFY